MSSPYLNKKMSLISKSGARYEGILRRVDPEVKTITMTDVVCFGTESRVNGKDAISPSSDIYEHIVFKSSDIDQIKFCGELAQDKSNKETPKRDPAIVSSLAKSSSSSFMEQKTKQVFSNTINQNKFSVKPSTPKLENVPKPASTYSGLTQPNTRYFASSFNPQTSVKTNQHINVESNPSRKRSSESTPTYAGIVSFHKDIQPKTLSNSSKYHNQPSYSQRNHSSSFIPQQEFDFDEANSLFNRTAINSGIEPGFKAYDPKKSFFDNISAEMKSEKYYSRKDDRRVNLITFGQYNINERQFSRSGNSRHTSTRASVDTKDNRNRKTFKTAATASLEDKDQLG